MKKAIALLAAVALALTINVGVFAAVDTDTARNLEWGSDSTDTNPKLLIEKNQIVLGYSINGGNVVVLPDTFLKPGNEYTYQLFRVDQDYSVTSVAPNNVQMTPITEGMLNGAKLRVRVGKGSSNVLSAKLNKKGSSNKATYSFVIEPKETFGTKINDLEYSIVASGLSAPGELLDAQLTFQTGYRAMSDEDIDSFVEGDTITIYEDRPVIEKEQFETIAKNFNYRTVEFMGEEGDWTFTGRVSGMGDANFITTYDVVPDIINAFPEQDYKFITFNAGVTFPTNGELRLDVSDMTDGTSNPDLYIYLYRNGVLTPINATYDNTSDELVFRTNYLGAFVITNGEISDYSQPDAPDESGDGDRDDDRDDNTNEAGNNPSTGAASVAGMAALGLGSLVAGIAVRKNRKTK
ncbi:hypothetical protein LJC63_04530 [Ruminococcaceae bacterium OttesenSCG-928-L11]|nr:hypothetical protein [Ruminococcaceae bacterium OttesenSCG-928-L11]